MVFLLVKVSVHCISHLLGPSVPYAIWAVGEGGLTHKVGFHSSPGHVH